MLARRDEADRAFCGRLLGAAGISYTIDHPLGAGDAKFTGMGTSDVVVLVDHPPYLQPIDGGPDVVYRSGPISQGMTHGARDVVVFGATRLMRSRAAVVRAFDFP